MSAAKEQHNVDGLGQAKQAELRGVSGSGTKNLTELCIMAKQARTMTPKIKLFSWTDGARISIDPQAAGEEIERLRLESAEALLAAAKPRSSSLHDAFDWDDKSAAHQNRLSTARLLLRSLRYEYKHVSNDPPPKPQRYFYVVKKNPEQERYVTKAKIMSDEELYEQVAQQLKEELLAFARRNAEFRGHKVLASVFEEIERLV